MVLGSKLNKSRECQDSAEALKDRGNYSCAANRYYYSLFQLAFAWAIKEDVLTSSCQGMHHKRVGEFLDEKAKNGEIDDSIVDIIADFKALRTKADYHIEKVNRQELKDAISDFTRAKRVLEQILRNNYA